MQQMSSAQIVSATSNMHPRYVSSSANPLFSLLSPCVSPVTPLIVSSPRMAPPVSGYSGFWQHPGLGQAAPPQDIKPFAQSPNPFLSHGDKTPSSLASMGPMGSLSQPASPAWQGRSIATHRLRLVEFSAYVEQQRDPETYNKHLFVHIGSPTPSDPLLEPVDVQQIQDKFPSNKEGLKELYNKGPQDGFFLVKFWADLNTNEGDDGSFYGVTST